jgi:kelch-like protein 2/3
VIRIITECLKFSALNVSFSGKDYLIEALKYHLLKGEQKILFKTPRTKPRQPVGLPKV